VNFVLVILLFSVRLSFVRIQTNATLSSLTPSPAPPQCVLLSEGRRGLESYSFYIKLIANFNMSIASGSISRPPLGRYFTQLLYHIFTKIATDHSAKISCFIREGERAKNNGDYIKKSSSIPELEMIWNSLKGFFV